MFVNYFSLNYLHHQRILTFENRVVQCRISRNYLII